MKLKILATFQKIQNKEPLSEDDKMKMNLEKFKIRFKSHYLAAFFLIVLATSVFYLTGENGAISEQNSPKQQQIVEKEGEPKAGNGSALNCNLFSGRWIFDNLSHPLYKERECSFLINDFACEKYGRKDLKYQNWKWQPHDCDLPRFNGTAFLEKIRGKKLVFAGDSLNRNQWVSLLCLIESSLHQSSPEKLIRQEGNLFIFLATEYNATIRFYWSPFLVESNGDDPFRHHVKDRIIRIKSIEKHAKHWTDADILIFDSFTWWVVPTMTILWGSFGSEEAIYKKVEMKLRRYEMALSTWSDWLEININRTKTKMFFMSLSPDHFRWGTGQQHCYNESEPILKEKYWGTTSAYTEMMQIAESVIKKLETRGLKVYYLNITQLSDYRIDAHPSIYGRFHHPPCPEQLAANPKLYSDCVHWCLPGVPDFWNEILYSYIINSL